MVEHARSGPCCHVTLGRTGPRFPGFGFRFDEIHHLFPSTLLTDALRRSGY